ncbi:MAG: hypothetical protein NT096_00190 [Proteobacteria bacterium]|nr:hypothetical protein [Pseudomonadota bacterium]
MSEPTGLGITIGGSLKDSDIEAFVEALNYEMYDISGPGPDSAQDFPESGKVLKNTWYGTSNYGECDDLKAFCESHGLAYRHDCSGSHDSTATIAYWLPGMKEAKSTFATTDGCAVVEVDAIQPYLNMLLTIMKDGIESLPLLLNDPNLNGVVSKALKSKKPYTVLEKEFKKIIPPTIPKIPDLIIV